MKFKKLALVLAVLVVASTVVPVLAKSPFADVPADHWAYDAVVELAAAGLIEGYPDGTFGGSRMLTRYEGAMVFARALARLEGKIAETDILGELDQIKAELMEAIKAELAAFDVPVEPKVLETVIVEKELDEAALARIKAAEMDVEVLGGDIAYVEHRVLGLIDGIRYDLDNLQEQLDGLEDVTAELPSLEEIEELVAAKIEEGILEAALSAKEVVKETTVIEKVIEEIEVDGLTEEDVERIAEALIAGQIQKYDLLLDETRTHLYNIYTRLDDVEAAQAETAAAIKELEKVRLGGSLDFKASNKEDEYGYGQSVDFNLNIKASDLVDVKTILKGGIPYDAKGPLSLSVYGVEVTSETPLKRLAIGNKLVTNAQIKERISDYALKLAADVDEDGKSYRFAALADFDLFSDLSANVFLGTPDASVDEALDLGLALQYKLVPELGLKVAVGAHKDADVALPGANGVYAGLFGEIAGVTYGGDFGLDLAEESDNMLFGGSLSTKLGPLGLSGKYYLAQDNYQVKRPFVAGGSNFMEFGADVEFAGIDVDGGFYREADADEEKVQAFRFGAETKFDVIIPISISGEYAFNKQDEDKTYAGFKVALAPEEPELGFRYGADFALDLGEYASGGNWKNGDIVDQNVATVGANVGYKADVRGAVVDLGYGATFRMPYEPEDDKVLTHKVDLGYNFTKDVKLTLGGSLKQVLVEPIANTWEYSAGLGISF